MTHTFDDELVRFDGGPTVRRRTFDDGTVVVEPFAGSIERGCRVMSGDAACGVGYVLQADAMGATALFPSVFGADVTVAVTATDRRLPDAVDASFYRPDGSCFGVDITELVMAQTHDVVLGLCDGEIPDFLATSAVASGAERCELAAAVSFYFGRMPELKGGALTVSSKISAADFIQGQFVERQLRSAPELALSI